LHGLSNPLRIALVPEVARGAVLQRSKTMRPLRPAGRPWRGRGRRTAAAAADTSRFGLYPGKMVSAKGVLSDNEPSPRPVAVLGAAVDLVLHNRVPIRPTPTLPAMPNALFCLASS
jgi:hypothetical protein